MSKPELKLLPTPFLVIVDSREQAPFTFAGLTSDARQGSRALLVRTERRGLRSGDYSLDGYEARVAVERKSLEDLFGTIGQGRDRFQRELARLNKMDYAAVVVESAWDIVLSGTEYSRLPPKVIHRSVIAWQQRFPRVHWWFCPNRRFAEITTFRILERYWRDHAKEEKASPQANV